MTKYKFFAFYEGKWQKFTGVFYGGYLYTDVGSFEFKKTKGRKIISSTISTPDIDD